MKLALLQTKAKYVTVLPKSNSVNNQGKKYYIYLVIKKLKVKHYFKWHKGTVEETCPRLEAIALTGVYKISIICAIRK